MFTSKKTYVQYFQYNDNISLLDAEYIKIKKNLNFNFNTSVLISKIIDFDNFPFLLKNVSWICMIRCKIKTRYQ